MLDLEPACCNAMPAMNKTPLALLLASLLSANAFAAPATHDRLTTLAQDMVQTSSRENPMQATFLGIPGMDGELVIPSEATRAAHLARLKGWAAQIDAIKAAAGPAISLVDADDAKLLRAQIDEELDGLLVRQTDRKDYAAPALALVGAIYTQFLHVPIPGRDDATAADMHQAWMDIVSRMEKGPAYIEAGQKLVTRPGKLYGTAGREQIAGAPDLLNGALTEAAKEQFAGDPVALARFVAARDRLLATLAKTDAFIKAHVDAWPDNFAMGRAAYDQMLQREELLPFTSKDIEGMARDELAHGWAEEAWLKSVAANRKASFGAETGGGMAPSGPALIDYYRERIAQLKQFVVEHDVVTLPQWLGAIDVVETPKFIQPVSPGASMESPRLFAKSANGYYFITPPESLKDAADRLDMNEDFDRDRILQTAAHEAMPGHFLQLSIARRHSDYIRKIQYSSVFAEGWAFYGEEMFVRLGLYGDDLDPRLFAARWERVRGARVIVDVKMASGEWTLAQAARFFEEQSGFTKSASEAAVAGYALRPGYVLAYTVGRLQLEQLLAEYQHRTGDKGSLRDFHDRLLSYGSVPFEIVGPELLADLGKSAEAVRASANY